MTVMVRLRAVLTCVVLPAAVGLAGFPFRGCGSPRQPSIEFTQVPEAGPGGAAKTVKIAGRATGKPGGPGPSVAKLGPGAWSIDARLFGRKRFDIDRTRDRKRQNRATSQQAG